MKDKINKVIDNFVAFDYNTALEIIKNQNVNTTKAEKTFVLIVGANGSGKSTFMANLIKLTNFDIEYINADLIKLQNNASDDYQTMLNTMELVKKLIKDCKSFAYETVFSHISKLELVSIAKQNGYKIITIFVMTDNAFINIERVNKRVSQGGHFVPPDKIVNRYKRTANNVEKLKAISDEFYVFNNSKDK